MESSSINRKLSICIPTFNRPNLTIESFIAVYGMDEVDEIVIVDDHSDIDNYNRLKQVTDSLPKVKLFRNESNKDCYFNKKNSVELCINKWVCLWDSDNIFGKDYVEQIFKIENWGNYAAMLPCFAMPHFNYTEFSGRTITKENVHRDAHNPTFTTMLNTANFFVDRDFYLQCWDGSVNPHTADSIYMNYLLLKNGGQLYVVPELHYLHRVDDHKNEECGHYNINLHKTPPGFHDGVIQKLKELR